MSDYVRSRKSAGITMEHVRLQRTPSGGKLTLEPYFMNVYIEVEGDGEFDAVRKAFMSKSEFDRSFLEAIDFIVPDESVVPRYVAS